MGKEDASPLCRREKEMPSKPKPSPAVAAAPPTPAVSVDDLFTTLARHTKDSDFPKAVKVADQILAIVPGDEDAMLCKVVGLIKSDDIDRAMRCIEGAQGLPFDLRYYKAYCLYRQNKQSEALAILRTLEKNADVLQLEAQILYRLGETEACIGSYEQLQKLKMDLSLDLKTNIIASFITAGKSSDVQNKMDELRVKATSSFEVAYNTACSLIEKGSYVEAEELLLRARRDGQEMLKNEDYADEEVESELAPIAVQLAYVQQLMGRLQEASAAYTEIINQNLADVASLAVATNNLIALKSGKEVSDGLRKLDRLIEKDNTSSRFQLTPALDVKLSLRQKEAIFVNRVLLLLVANRLDQARELAFSLLEMFPDSVMPSLLQAAVLVRGNKAAKAEDLLVEFSKKFPEKSKPVLLALSQVAAAAGHPQLASESLSKISDIQHMPATVATLVSLRERCGDISAASTVLESAIQWWANSMLEENSKLNTIMHEAAAFKLKHGQQEQAFQIYEELVNSYGSTEALVGLVKAAAHVDVDKAESYAKRLKPLPGLDGVNVGSLEKTSGAKNAEGSQAVYPAEEVNLEAKKEKSKKRKRKPKYPKGFDPANPGPPPDPERWLPRRERSSYKPRRKDKRAAQVRGSQGAVIREKNETNSVTTTTAASSSSKTNQATASTSKSSEQTKALSSKSRKKSKR